MRVLAFLILTLAPVEAQQFAAAQISRHILTNEGVVQLAKAGFDEQFIVACIRASRIQFDTTVDGLISLKRAGVSEDLKEVYAEAKGTGFDVKIIRQIVRLRKIEVEQRREQEELLELYKSVLGMEI